jgi:hypothetical protein
MNNYKNVLGLNMIRMCLILVFFVLSGCICRNEFIDPGVDAVGFGNDRDALIKCRDSIRNLNAENAAKDSNSRRSTLENSPVLLDGIRAK